MQVSLCRCLALAHCVASTALALPTAEASPGGKSAPHPQHGHDSPSASAHPLSEARSTGSSASKPYLSQKTHLDKPYQVVHFHKAKVGDHSVMHALSRDHNMQHYHGVLTSVSNAEKAHQDTLQFRNTHAGIKNDLHTFYKTENHLGVAEEHEAAFLDRDERGNLIDPKREGAPLHPFKSLGHHLDPHLPVLIHATSPITLDHLREVSEMAKAKGVSVEQFNGSHGHNSQQPVAREKKTEAQHEYLSSAQAVLHEQHPNARVHWTGAHNMYDKEGGGMSVPRTETEDIIHPHHRKAATKDTFFGPYVEKVEKHVNKYGGIRLPKAGRPLHYLRPSSRTSKPVRVGLYDASGTGSSERRRRRRPLRIVMPATKALPPNYSEEGYTLSDAVSDMRHTMGRPDADIQRVQKGRAHFNPWMDAAREKMRALSVNTYLLHADDVHHNRKRLDRLSNEKNFRSVFRDNNDLKVEMADAIALAGMRQGQHNAGSTTGLHLRPIKWRNKGQRVVSEEGTEGDNHGYGLVHVNAHEAFKDHKHLVKGGSDKAWKEDARLAEREREGGHKHAADGLVGVEKGVGGGASV